MIRGGGGARGLFKDRGGQTKGGKQSFLFPTANRNGEGIGAITVEIWNKSRDRM